MNWAGFIDSSECLLMCLENNYVKLSRASPSESSELSVLRPGFLLETTRKFEHKVFYFFTSEKFQEIIRTS